MPAALHLTDKISIARLVFSGWALIVGRRMARIQEQHMRSR
jgi:hypothetical protein